MRSGAKVCQSCRSRQELSNEYFVFTCKIDVDTAENEPLKITDSAAGQNAEFVVSTLLKANLVVGAP